MDDLDDLIDELPSLNKSRWNDLVVAEWNLLRYAWKEVQDVLKTNNFPDLTAQEMMKYILLEHIEGTDCVFQKVLIQAATKSTSILIKDRLEDYFCAKKRIESLKVVLNA